MRVATAQIMRELDRETIDDIGIPGLVLMENAGRAAGRIILQSFPQLGEKRVGVFCGPGNNGGDGFVITRYLIEKGVDVHCYLLCRRDRVRGDALTNLQILERMGARVEELPGPEGFKAAHDRIRGCDLIVDAILGTGLASDLKGYFLEVIRFLNALGKPICSVDIPSGLDSDTGRPRGESIRAELTVTFGLPKLGHILLPGAAYCGRLERVDIGIPPSVIRRKHIPYNLIEPMMLKDILKPRPLDSHKGQFGHLLVLAGSAGKTGAAAMTCEAALRTGVGLVTLGIPKGLNQAMEAKLTEVMTLPLPETEDGSLDVEALEIIIRLCKDKSAIAIGPGISTHPSTQRLVRRLIGSVPIPKIIDADGLNALVGHLDLLSSEGEKVLTPHPGEMARMLGSTPQEVQQNRLETARSFSMKWNVYLVLKGARSLVSDPQGEIYINPTGNPAMASGGTGDVLTGIIAGLVAQGIPILEAMTIGVYIHGKISDKIAEETGQRGLTATDIIPLIPAALKNMAS